ncbi:unnamed protein product [Adineta steineri]|uniref:Uncharacterized protein n=1 Tax=Adineta steineri TaxID=433720 RepID=A0A819A6K1_9BILA|nr:unnamed protein product [Adineta steineri]CAF3773176.1 unnamed protein product [Adineta steineri]
MTNSSRDTAFYSPPPSNVGYENSLNMNTTRPLGSLSQHDIQKMKYKIDLDKQLAEQKQRNTLEWETKLERDKKYAKQQAVFGRHDYSTPIKKQDLEQIVSQSTQPIPLLLRKPEQLSLHYQQLNVPNGINNLLQQSTDKNSSQYSPRTVQSSTSQNNVPDFHRLYGTTTYGNKSSSHVSSSTAQPVKGDAHDPFMSFDPNKEPQQVFNLIPQQNLYEPWGRPGAGAPLVHQHTGQKFTRYAGSLEEKLNTVGPLSLYRNQYYSESIDEQKRDAQIQQKRREEELMERRLNDGGTAGWIAQLEGGHYPLKFHKPTTQITRHNTGTQDTHSPEEIRTIRNDLAQQAEQRARLQQIARQEDNIADLQHTETQSGWWGKDGARATKTQPRRFNALNALHNSQSVRSTNSFNQTNPNDNKPSLPVRYYDTHFQYPKANFVSKHTNFYQLSDSNNT